MIFTRKKPGEGVPQPGSKARPSPLDIALPALAGVLVVAMLVSGWLLFDKKSDINHVADVRGCFLAAAEDSANDVVNMTADNVDEQIQVILDGATGGYRQRFEGTSEQFATMARDVNVKMEGHVVAAAVEDNTDTTGTVLVVSVSEVTNTNTPEPKTAYYRMRLTVDKVDGQCKTSDIEYVN